MQWSAIFRHPQRRREPIHQSRSATQAPVPATQRRGERYTASAQPRIGERDERAILGGAKSALSKTICKTILRDVALRTGKPPSAGWMRWRGWTPPAASALPPLPSGPTPTQCALGADVRLARYQGNAPQRCRDFLQRDALERRQAQIRVVERHSRRERVRRGDAP